MKNERLLISRNKREGEYYGKEYNSRTHGWRIPGRHCRATGQRLSLKRYRIVWL